MKYFKVYAFHCTDTFVDTKFRLKKILRRSKSFLTNYG